MAWAFWRSTQREGIHSAASYSYVHLLIYSLDGMAAAAADDVMMTTVIEGEASRRCDVEITRTTYLFERLNDLLLSA